MMYVYKIINHFIFSLIYNIILQIDLHDCQGRERFKTRNISNLYHRADAVLLTYSIEETDTFDNLTTWIEECRENLWGASGREVVWALIGNKSDLIPEVDPDRVEDICDTLETTLSFSVSAKTGDNVVKSFRKIVEVLHEHRLRLSNGKKRKDSFVLSNTIESNKTCCS